MCVSMDTLLWMYMIGFVSVHLRKNGKVNMKEAVV